MKQAHELKNHPTIRKTLLASKLFDGFWDRWLAHGVEKHELAKIRSSFSTKKNWTDGWKLLADQKSEEARALLKTDSHQRAETAFRTAGLYYQMNQWLVPEPHKEKISWLNMGVDIVRQADHLSSIPTKYESVELEDGKCVGRVRIPPMPKGVVIMINPFDSTKEELFTYEMSFIDGGYAVLNFDGPGQGETFSNQGLKATANRWQQYVDRLIQYAESNFPQLNIYLFGTSSGAAWVLYGSCSPSVSKAVAVSPAFIDEKIQLPDYFLERTKYLIEMGDTILPDFRALSFRNSVMLVHGKKDVMVSGQNIYKLYQQLPNGKCFLEYDEEGHCCNYKLPEIWDRSMKWFQIRKDEM